MSSQHSEDQSKVSVQKNDQQPIDDKNGQDVEQNQEEQQENDQQPIDDKNGQDVEQNQEEQQENDQQPIDDKNGQNGKQNQKEQQENNQQPIDDKNGQNGKQNQKEQQENNQQPIDDKNGQNGKQNQKEQQENNQQPIDDKNGQNGKQNQKSKKQLDQQFKNNKNVQDNKTLKAQQNKPNSSQNGNQGDNIVKQKDKIQNKDNITTPGKNPSNKLPPLTSKKSFKMKIDKSPEKSKETVIGCFGKIRNSNKIQNSNNTNNPTKQPVSKNNSQIKIDIKKFQYEKQEYKDFIHNGSINIWSVFKPNELFKKTNIGLYLYFQFLFYLFILLGLLMFPSLVKMIISYYQFNGFLNSGYNSSMQTNLLKYSVGNIQKPSFYHFNISVACQTISILLIFGFYVLWRYKTQDNIDDYSNQIPEISQYSIGIRIGTNTNKFKIQPEKLRDNQLFELLDQIAPIYDFKGQYQNILEYIKLQKQLNYKTNQTNKQKPNQESKQNIDQKDKQTEERIKKQKREKMNKLAQSIKSSDIKHFQQRYEEQYPLDPIMYIMQFKTKKARMTMIDQLMKRNQVDAWYSCFLCCNQQVKKDQIIIQIETAKNQHEKAKLMLTQTKVSNPEDMTWENIKVSSLQQTLARILIYLSIPFITVGSSLLVSFTGKEVQINKLSRQVNCNIFNDRSEQYVQQNIANLDLTYCYCLDNFPSFGDICSKNTKFTNQIINGMMASSATALLSTSMNVIMVQAIPYMTSLGKYKTISEKENVAYWITTFATVINSLFLPLITSLQFNGISFASLIGYYTKEAGVSTDSSLIQRPNVSFPDMTRDWYMYALPFYFSLLVNAIIIPLIQCLIFFSPKIWDKIKGYVPFISNNQPKEKSKSILDSQSQGKVLTTMINEIKSSLKKTVQNNFPQTQGLTFSTMLQTIKNSTDSQSKIQKLAQNTQKIFQTFFLKDNSTVQNGKNTKIEQSIKQVKKKVFSIISQKKDNLVKQFQNIIKQNIPSQILQNFQKLLKESMEKAQINQKTLSQFSIQKNANMLTFNLFIILCYSVQQPLFIIMGCLLVLVEYCSHKYIVIKFSKKMVIKKGQINEKFLTLLPVIIVIRCIFAIMTYTCPQMFQKQLFEHLNLWSYTIENYPTMERFLQIGIFSVLMVLSLLLVLVQYFFNDIDAAILMMFPSYRTQKIKQTKDKAYLYKQAEKNTKKAQLGYFDNKLTCYQQKNNISTPFLRSYDVYQQLQFKKTLKKIFQNKTNKTYNQNNNNLPQQSSSENLNSSKQELLKK